MQFVREVIASEIFNSYAIEIQFNYSIHHHARHTFSFPGVLRRAKLSNAFGVDMTGPNKKALDELIAEGRLGELLVS